MERLKLILNRDLTIISSLMKQTILILFLFLNYYPVKAQFWKFRSNVTKIDSLELVINRDRDTHNKGLYQSNDLSTRLTNKLDSLTLKLNYMRRRIDSLEIALKKTVKADIVIANETNSESSNIFCPDDAMLEQMEYLQNCCCLIDEACPNKTSAGGLRIIREGYQMAIVRKDIIIGSCWDFINKVYSNSGFKQANRETIYKGKKGSKYPNPELLHPGDWVYHVNYSYHNIEHSAIFICWKDYDKRMAITLSYVGQNRSSPGKYGIYDLSGIYNIMRAKE